MPAMRDLNDISDLAGNSGPSPTRVVILYDNLECGKQARRTYSYLVESLREVCEFTVQLWKFNLLEDARLKSIAAQDAAEADIVILSLQGDAELPGSIKSWFKLWFKAKPAPLGLVALFIDPARAGSVREYLEKVAKKAGVDFFAQPGRGAGTEKPLTPLGFAALTR